MSNRTEVLEQVTSVLDLALQGMLITQRAHDAVAEYRAILARADAEGRDVSDEELRTARERSQDALSRLEEAARR